VLNHELLSELCHLRFALDFGDLENQEQRLVCGVECGAALFFPSRE